MVPRQNQVSDQMRSLIFKFLYEDFKPEREVARTLNIPKSTVNSIIKKFEETEQVSISTRGGARNTIITQLCKTSWYSVPHFYQVSPFRWLISTTFIAYLEHTFFEYRCNLLSIITIIAPQTNA
ncbi:hypothetical protein RF11_05476 [Thelohanellus kitauei]|uniref:Uncharacterized protein n=1 Tax=Thelohanellus kitauei TaxID=669202 RepID=A0A0C2MSL9_THEKT|nr:hypothetical protein RF11_05476 [Thelohanellus kitauei]